MKKLLLGKKIIGCAIVASAFIGGGALAQAYPSRNITVLDNVTGGPQEAVKRAILAKVKDNTGATMVYEGRPGGGGAPGLQAVKNAAPDGYTIGVTYSSALNLGPLINTETGLDALRDFVPITKVWNAANIWIGRADHPAKDIRDLVAMAKAKPDSVKVGLFGAGNRLFIALLEEKTGAKFLGVPFKSTGDTQAAVLGGHIDAAFDVPAVPMGQAGKIKAFLYGVSPVLPQLPNVPSTIDVYGIETSSWTGFLAPAKTQSEQINWLSRELIRAMKDPAIAKLMQDALLPVVVVSPAGFAADLKKEVEEYRAALKRFPDIR
jgi:tripartite-type tricarboxylate transporter receptor subunit TctC